MPVEHLPQSVVGINVEWLGLIYSVDQLANSSRAGRVPAMVRQHRMPAPRKLIRRVLVDYRPPLLGLLLSELGRRLGALYNLYSR
jgi:hypothetical protein